MFASTHSRPLSLALGSADDTLVIVSPALMEALRRAAPRPRRSRVPFVLGLALVALVLGLAADRSTREYVSAHLTTNLPNALASLPSP